MGSDSLAVPDFLPAGVSIHAPAWGATDWLAVLTNPEKFQFTLPHGERQIGKDGVELGSKFQFTLPHGERPLGIDGRYTVSSFNSRSRMGSDR